MFLQNTPSKVQIIKADRVLQAKVGTGSINSDVIRRAQQVMDNNEVDFAPMAKEYLEKLANAIQEARDGQNMEYCIKAMRDSVMQLKANASVFHYGLIGNLANIMLSFLESIKELDNDAIDIVSAHHRTLSAIVIKKMAGNGGSYGLQMEEELKSACNRYFSQKP